MSRRAFLQSSLGMVLGLGGLSGSARLHAAPVDTGSRFLLVFLRGAYDAASLLVPISSRYYYEVRPNIAIGRPAAAPSADAAASAPAGTTPPAAPPATALPINADWGLHPALANSIWPLVQQRQAAFVPFAGDDADVSRSHFETQDTLELGQLLGGRRDLQSGFLNRLAGQLQRGALPIAFTPQLPLSMRGNARQIVNISLRQVPKSTAGDRLRDPILQMYARHELQESVSDAFQIRDEVARELQDSGNSMGMGADTGGRRAISAKGFELEARRIAKLMRERYSLGFIDVGGWDTHVGQGNASGYLANRLEELGRGLRAYADELGEAAWSQSVVVVMSEFGRTVRENGNRGTDHGHGSVYWVLGGGLSGGPVVGEQQAVEAGKLFQNRDLPVLNDYRAVLGGLFRRQFGLSDEALAQVFPGAQARDLGLI